MPGQKPQSSGTFDYPLYVDRRVTAHVDDISSWTASLGARAVSSAADLSGVTVGDVVEVTGDALGNPLLSALDFVATMLPLVVGPESAHEARPRRPAPTASVAAARAAADEEAGTQRVLMGTVTAARDGLRDNPVVDVLLRTDAELIAILVLDREVLTAAGEEQLRGGRFRVVGKVSAVLGKDDHVNLFRRTPIAATGVEASRDMVSELIEAGVDVEVADPVVEGPALQILPLAVLV